ncbi:MAG: hypothetical protein LC750_18735, partial [Actinobacteria bacterium]|nr:hypothetical protein [Actinomycetota bacterium]
MRKPKAWILLLALVGTATSPSHAAPEPFSFEQTARVEHLYEGGPLALVIRGTPCRVGVLARVFDGNADHVVDCNEPRGFFWLQLGSDEPPADGFFGAYGPCPPLSPTPDAWTSFDCLVAYGHYDWHDGLLQLQGIRLGAQPLP